MRTALTEHGGVVSFARLVAPASFTDAIVAHLYLARAVNAGLVFVATLVGATLAGAAAPLAPWTVWLAASNALLAAASTALNDWHDAAADAINRPDRPIPSGRISSDRAILLSLAWFGMALGAAALALPALALQALVIVGLSAWYTFRLKGVPFVGNAVAALVWAYPLWCWMAVSADVPPAYVAVTAAFVMTGIGQELLNTAVDARGDRATSVRTVATVWGLGLATRLGVVCLAAAVPLAWVPVTLGLMAPAYEWGLVVVSVALVCIALPQGIFRPDVTVTRRIVVVARAMVILQGLALTWDLLVPQLPR